MAAVNTLVIRTAGTNCDEETLFAFEQCGSSGELVHANNLIAGEHKLSDFQILAIPGGFTYGDDVASGKVFAVELVNALGEMIQGFVDNGGLVIGICNGFQVLVKTGLLPDAKLTGSDDRRLTLTHNDSHKFEDRWVWLQAADNTKCVFVEPGEKVYFPAAHAEGKLVAKDEKVLEELIANGQVVYRYVNEDGSKPSYPADPNGSIDNIAGICDNTGRIFGLMPHPERHFLPTQHPHWTRNGLKEEGDGVGVFRKAVNYFQK
ncbi:MAG: phosphoribosylformylglycinamidine synthase I [Planctomycetota bacterium]|jgi:phosphoribosylformylglycinamidine synthase